MHLRILTAALAVIVLIQFCAAQTRTVGMLRNEAGTFDGLTLFAPMGATTTHLIDSEGRQVRSWTAAQRPGQAAYLLPNGHLLRAGMEPFLPGFNGGGVGARVQKFDWDGTLLWNFLYATPLHRLHHDICPMPNGNVLMIAWELKTRAEWTAAGKNPATSGAGPLWPDHIIEVQQTGDTTGAIVWEWHAWDHLVQDFDSTKANYGNPAENPQLIDLNFGGRALDWMHSNAVAYNAELDQVILCVHNFNEFWVIDHSTTTAEAASHTGGTLNRGGDLLYRWGNPRTYRAGTAAEQKLYGMHDAHWIETGLRGEGNILVFNNGLNRPAGKYSSVEEITPPLRGDRLYDYAPGLPFAPADASWIFTATPKETFISENISSAQRLPNGNTFICEGARGRFFEIAADGSIVWEYVNPVTGKGILAQGDTVPTDLGSANNVFKARKYARNFPGFTGRDLTPGSVIERNATAVDGMMPTGVSIAIDVPQPHPVRSSATVRIQLAAEGPVLLTLHDVLGRSVATLADNARMDAGSHVVSFALPQLPRGMYLLRLAAGGATATREILLAR
ncbi:MAG: aryl-sulfate sulfotransferase [Ignavibacteria bacterium]|nr:aryl-sulfate sulfotransferase [Ignavibacteria bacterium]